MTMFSNFFACNCGNDKIEEITDDLERLEVELKNINKDITLFNMKIMDLEKFNCRLFTDLKQLENRLDAKFDNLTNKIDAILLYMKK